MNAPQSLAEMKSPAPREASMPAVTPGFGSLQSFELSIRQAKLLSSSTLVPAQYRGIIEKKKGRDTVYEENDNAIPNCVIAMNMATRMGGDPLMVMQNLYIVEGRPSWSSQWIIAAINGCGRFSPLRFELKDHGQKEVEYTVTEWIDGNKQNKKVKTTIRNLECVAWSVEKGFTIPQFGLDDLKKNGGIYGCCKTYGIPIVESPAVNMEMAVKEGWYQKNGSKWQTMPEVMLRYRTASFFGKLYAPELLMGLQTVEEMQDIVIDARQDESGTFTVDLDNLRPSATGVDPANPGSDRTANVTVNTSTGEIIDHMQDDGGSRAGSDTDDDQLRQVEQAGQQQQNGPGFEDAIAAVKAGDFDMARDMARGLAAGQKQAVENAINNAKQPEGESQPQPRQRRERGANPIE